MSIGHRASETQVLTPFEYGSLDSETRIVVEQKTGEIRDRIKRSAQDMIEIGERLIDIKARLGHGQFLSWLEAEFDWSVQTAHNLMHVAEAFKFTTVVNLPIGQKALYALASRSVPEEARAEAIALAESGEEVTHSKVKQIIADHKPRVDPEPPEDSGSSRVEDEEEPEPVQPVQSSLLPEEPDASDEPAEPEDEEAEARNARAEELWNKFLNDFGRFVVSFPKHGGVVNITRGWPRKRVTGFIFKLEQLGNASLKYAAELRRASK